MPRQTTSSFPSTDGSLRRKLENTIAKFVREKVKEFEIETGSIVNGVTVNFMDVTHHGTASVAYSITGVSVSVERYPVDQQ